MKDECSFVTIDGAATIEEQQAMVREIVGHAFDLPLLSLENHSVARKRCNAPKLPRE